MLQHVFALFSGRRFKTAQPLVAISIFFLAGTLSACETDVEIDVPAHTPRLAVQFTLRSDESSQGMYIGRSQSVLSSEDLWRSGLVKNALITIKDSEGIARQGFVFKPDPNYAEGGGYQPVNPFLPVPGQQYTLTVSAPNFETVQGSLTMPVRVPLVSASFQPANQSGRFGYTGRLRIEFHDPEGQKNYYRIVVRAVDTQGRTVSEVYHNNEKGDIFGEEVEQIELNKVFDDGWARQGVISFTNNVGYYGDYTNNNPPFALEVTLQHLTQDLYLYERSRENYQEDNPFAEPLNLHSNIRNGYGNFGGITTAKFGIKL